MATILPQGAPIPPLPARGLDSDNTRRTTPLRQELQIPTDQAHRIALDQEPELMALVVNSAKVAM
jgi:hypothetical protein